MKKFFKILLIVLVVLIILFLGLMAYLYFGKGGDRSTMNIIPSDAIFAIETTNLSKGWETISESNVWKHLAGNPYFGEINESLQEVDELLKDNKAVQILLEDRRLLLSTHMTSTSDYDFLFIIDLQKASKLSFLTNTIGILGYEVNKSKYEGIEILELIDKETEDKMYLGIIDNLLVGSFDNRLLEKAIAMKNNKFWTENTKFLQVASEISNTSLLRFYFNYSQLDNFMKAYLAHENESISSISKSLAYSAFELDFQNDELNFTGHTNMDTASSYIKALSKVKPGRMKAFDVISDQAAFYMAMCFENYLDFYDRLKKEFSYENINESENFDKNVRKLEKYLNINLHDDFFSWIGSEIAFIKLRPSQNSRAEDIVVAIHANNISKAKSGLQHIITQVGKKSPMHFDVSTYKNFDINYLNIKGFFKLILGKLFGKLEKPYFTYINDFVIFSNSKSTLEDVISGYVSGKTLSHSQEFMDFIDRFESKSNASIFVQMPKMYSNLYYFTKDDTKKSMQENRELILSFSKIGLQLVSQGELLEAKMIALHDSTALLTDAIEKLEYQTAENLFVNEYESLSFKITLEDDVMKNDGRYKSTYPDSVLKADGVINLRLLNGLWRGYYESGNLMNAVNYVDDQVNGTALFYYDKPNPQTKSEVNFKEDKIIGEYREFYKNGVRKAVLKYEDGKRNGIAEFYYKTGVLKIQGEFKDSKKHGKWIYFDKNGNEIAKEKWKKGTKK